MGIPSKDVGTNADTTDLLKYLGARPGWNSAENICAGLGWHDPVGEPNTRKLRDVVQHNQSIISGDDGYQLLQFASFDDFTRAVSRQYAKIRSMGASIRAKIDAWQVIHPVGTVGDLIIQMNLPGLVDAYAAAGGSPSDLTPGAKTIEKAMSVYAARQAAMGLPVDDGFTNTDARERENEDQSP